MPVALGKQFPAIGQLWVRVPIQKNPSFLYWGDVQITYHMVLNEISPKVEYYHMEGYIMQLVSIPI